MHTHRHMRAHTGEHTPTSGQRVHVRKYVVSATWKAVKNISIFYQHSPRVVKMVTLYVLWIAAGVALLFQVHVPTFNSMYSSNNCSVVILTAVIKRNKWKHKWGPWVYPTPIQFQPVFPKGTFVHSSFCKLYKGLGFTSSPFNNSCEICWWFNNHWASNGILTWPISEGLGLSGRVGTGILTGNEWSSSFSSNFRTRNQQSFHF